MDEEQKRIVEEEARRCDFLANRLVNESQEDYEKRLNRQSLELLPLDNYSNTIIKKYSKEVGLYYEYKNCDNNNIILESSFNRVIDVLHNKDWAILSAFRSEFDLQTNIKRNRILRSKLNSKQSGPHQLVGHWREAPEGVDYNDATENQLTDVVERTYLVPRPQNMGYEDFKNWIASLLTIEGVTQDCGIIHKYSISDKIQQGKISVENSEYFLLFPNGTTTLLGKNLTANKIAQAYSQYVRKLNVPFVFEGIETPSSISGRMMFRSAGINYL